MFYNILNLAPSFLGSLKLVAPQKKPQGAGCEYPNIIQYLSQCPAGFWMPQIIWSGQKRQCATSCNACSWVAWETQNWTTAWTNVGCSNRKMGWFLVFSSRPLWFQVGQIRESAHSRESPRCIAYLVRNSVCDEVTQALHEDDPCRTQHLAEVRGSRSSFVAHSSLPSLISLKHFAYGGIRSCQVCHSHMLLCFFEGSFISKMIQDSFVAWLARHPNTSLETAAQVRQQHCLRVRSQWYLDSK